MPMLSGNYLLQWNVDDLHHETLDWLSTTALWNRETAFFQKLLDTYGLSSPRMKKCSAGRSCKKFIDEYSSDVVTRFRESLLDHESKLAGLLRDRKNPNLLTFTNTGRSLPN
ncbi:MAG: hypothetical protein WDN75_19465 [Bacteroidota bacterium]